MWMNAIDTLCLLHVGFWVNLLVIKFEHLCCWQQAFLYDHGLHTHTAPQVARLPFERFRFKVGRHLTISGRWGQRWQHNQSKLEKIGFTWAYGFRGLKFMMVEQGHSCRSNWELPSGSLRRRQRTQWEWQSSFETSKPAARVTPIPTRPYLPPSNFSQIVPLTAD